MISARLCGAVQASLFVLLPLLLMPLAQSQGAKKNVTATSIADGDTERDNDHEEERSAWFMHGRTVPGKSAAELRHRAYQVKMQARTARLARAQTAEPDSQPPPSSSGWTPLGPVPLASDATGTGFQNYDQVSGRATAVVIDPADPTGNTIFIGGAQGGVWKSTNAATSIANNVTWTAVTDDQATLSIGSIAIQPGNSNPAQSVVLVATGEADNSADSYFGLGILRSADGGNTWALVPTANSGSLSFSGLGGTRMAFSTATGQTGTVVAAMAASSEGSVAGALTTNTYRGLYTSTDAGQTWIYDALFSGGTGEATSATSVVYNAVAGLFFAALRYHGFYSSPDGVTWTPLANQPGAPGLLGPTACPQSYVTTCPLYRGEITVVPGRNEMYVWFVSPDSNNNPVDQGIWQSVNGGASWTQISDSGIMNCGDVSGCGVEQGFYDLELLALPDGTGTDLYAGAINLYKCSLSSINPTCAATPFVNLTHVYGCDPLGALAHVHPDQHALAYMIPTSGADLMYFANDGGIYRALNGFTGLTTGSCSGTNQFDDLNQNLGSMTQFVSFSQHPANANIIFGGTQDNGSPATATATTSSAWENVLSGDGGYSALDPNTGNWFASNPDTGSGSLNIQECSSGVNCNDSLFSVVVSSSNVGGDDGAFYFPYILDPQSTSSLLVGTCRVWSGPRSGGAFTVLSLNFDTLGTGTCAGTEVNVVRALAAGGATNANGSEVIYATTDGPGPNNLSTPIGGNVWATTNGTAVSGTVSTFANATLNGPGGSSINPNQFPVSSVAIDSSDSTGNTAYVTVMGFTGGSVTATCNATALPGAQCTLSPVSPIRVGSAAVVPVTATVSVPSNATPGNYNVNINTQDSTGEPIHSWTIALTVQDFAFSPVMPTTQTVGAGQSAIYNLSVMPVGAGFAGAVSLSCTGAPANSTCGFAPNPVTPGSGPAAVVLTIPTSATIPPSNYNMTITGTSGSLSHSTTLSLTIASSFQLAVTQAFSVAADPGSQQTAKISLTPNYTGSVTAACDASALSGTQCTLTPPNPIAISGVPIAVTAQINIPSNAAPGTYNININVQDTSGNPSHSLTLPFTVIQDFTLGTLSPATQTISAGESASYNFSVLPVGASFTNAVTLSCSGAPAVSLCSFTPNPITPGSSSAAVVMSITTTASSSSLSRTRTFYALWLAMPALALLGTRKRWKKRRKLRLSTSLFGLFLLGLMLCSCGGGGSNGSGSGSGGGGGGGLQQGTQTGTYTITVTGTSGTLSHPASTVTLIVN